MFVSCPQRVRMGLAVALSVLAAACAKTEEKKPVLPTKPKNSVELRVIKKANGHPGALALPTTRPVEDYDNASSTTVLTWRFKHKATTIVFDPPPSPSIPRIPPPDCTKTAKQCTVTLPAGLAPSDGVFLYKYTVTGKTDTDEDIDGDPFIEIDR